MAIENRNVEPGTKLIARYKKEEYRAEVVAGEGGKAKFRLADGREFKSPSSAGTAITGKACNGWAFWGLDHGASPEMESTTEAQTPTGETEDTTAEPPDSTEDSEPEPESTYVTAGEEFTNPAATPSFRRVPNQRGLADGMVRLYCNTCQKSFTTAADQRVDACPAGHLPNAQALEA